MIELNCPSCQKLYRLADSMAGKRGKCKACGELMVIPELPQAPEDANASQADGDAAPNTDVWASASESAGAAPALQPAATGGIEPGGDLFASAAAMAAESSPVADSPAGTFPSGRPSQLAINSTESRETLTGSSRHLNYEISQRPDFSIVKVDLPAGGKVYAEPSAMVSMSPSVQLEAGFKGGLGKTFGRMLGGESLIINTFTAANEPAEILFAGGAAGDVAHYELAGNTLYLQRGAYMFNSEGVEVSGKWQGAKGFFSGEGLVLLKATGAGDLFFNSYGAIMPIDVTGDFMVDTGYIVAFEESLQYRVTVLPGLRKAGKIKSFFFGGEGLVCQFTGTGRVWIQTRQVSSFLSWVHPYRPASRN